MQMPKVLIGLSGVITIFGCEEKKVKYKYLIPRKCQLSTVLRSNLMRLYFPVDSTGYLIMIEKLVSSGT